MTRKADSFRKTEAKYKGRRTGRVLNNSEEEWEHRALEALTVPYWQRELHDCGFLKGRD